MAPEVQLLAQTRGQDVLGRDTAVADQLCAAKADAWSFGACLVAMAALHCPAGCTRRNAVSLPALVRPGSKCYSSSFIKLVGKLCVADARERVALHDAWVGDPWLEWAR